MTSRLTVSTVVASLFAASAIAVVSFGPTPALAYASKADCEAHEGAGKCDHCPMGKGDPGWHTKKACGTALSVQRDNDLKLSKVLATVEGEERAKVARAKEKAR